MLSLTAYQGDAQDNLADTRLHTDRMESTGEATAAQGRGTAQPPCKPGPQPLTRAPKVNGPAHAPSTRVPPRRVGLCWEPHTQG